MHPEDGSGLSLDGIDKAPRGYEVVAPASWPAVARASQPALQIQVQFFKAGGPGLVRYMIEGAPGPSSTAAEGPGRWNRAASRASTQAVASLSRGKPRGYEVVAPASWPAVARASQPALQIQVQFFKAGGPGLVRYMIEGAPGPSSTAAEGPGRDANRVTQGYQTGFEYLSGNLSIPAEPTLRALEHSSCNLTIVIGITRSGTILPPLPQTSTPERPSQVRKVAV